MMCRYIFFPPVSQLCCKVIIIIIMIIIIIIIIIEPCHAAPVTIQKFLEMRCCLTKCSEKNQQLLLL